MLGSLCLQWNGVQRLKLPTEYPQELQNLLHLMNKLLLLQLWAQIRRLHDAGNAEYMLWSQDLLLSEPRISVCMCSRGLNLNRAGADKVICSTIRT